MKGPTTAQQLPIGPARKSAPDEAKLLEQYGCGPVRFTGTDDALYERHLLFDAVIAQATAGPRERFEALARSVRDVLPQRWVRTEETYARENPKRIYYLSMEYLLGRSLANNVTNLSAKSPASEQPACKRSSGERDRGRGLIELRPIVRALVALSSSAASNRAAAVAPKSERFLIFRRAGTPRPLAVGTQT
jgi:hypothetical protein